MNKSYSIKLALIISVIVFHPDNFPQDNRLKSNNRLPAFTKIVVPYSERYEKYHSSLLESSDDEIIKITLDSLLFDNNNLFLYSTFYNKSDSTIYILQQSECINPFRFIIKNSDGGRIERGSSGFICDVHPRHAPNSYDLIEIPASGIYHYTNIKAYSYYFSKLPGGEYSVKLEYYYHKPNSIIVNGPDTDNNDKYYSDWIYTAQVTLRGKYTSQSSLSFNK